MNEWYLGEDTKEYEDGRVMGTEGSLRWSRDGALPGIVMKANPQPETQAYFQEFYQIVPDLVGEQGSHVET